MTSQKICSACGQEIPSGALFCLSCGASSPTEIAETSAEGWSPVTPPQGAVRRSTSDEAIQSRLSVVQGALGAGFEIKGLIGRGGFGEVWAALDTQLGREVAIKVLRAELSSDPDFRARFRREARAIARLRHPGIVPIYHVGEAAGLVYFVMPLVHGVTLKAALQDPEGLHADEAVRILIEAAGALREAHQHGVVHRDLKPENIMLEGARRRALLMDFGVAKLDEPAAPTGEGVTGADIVLGSPEYMSPEQATGRALDARSDIYSLGVVAYRMLAGRLPFDAETPREVLAHHVLSAPAPLGAQVRISDTVAQAVMRCLAKLPEERWQSAEEFARALVGGNPRFSGGEETVAVPPAERPARLPGRRRVAVSVALLVFLVVGAATPWPIARWWREHHRPVADSSAAPAPAPAVGGPLALLASPRAGCGFHRSGDTMILVDRVPNDNCWFPVDSVRAVSVPFVYQVRFRASALAAHAGIGLAWCQGETRNCRIAFVWPGERAVWGRTDPRRGMAPIALGSRANLRAGDHVLRVLFGNGSVQCTLDGAIVLERIAGADSAFVADPDAVDLIVQNMTVALAGPDAIRVRPSGQP